MFQVNRKGDDTQRYTLSRASMSRSDFLEVAHDWGFYIYINKPEFAFYLFFDMCKFPGQGLNPCHSSNPSHCNGGSQARV